MRTDEKRREQEERHMNRCDHLYSELDREGYERRKLADQLIKTEMDYLHAREERDRLQEKKDRQDRQ